MTLIDFPVIKTGLEIGFINLETNRVQPLSNIDFTCTSSAECCSTLRIPVTSHDIDRIIDNGYEIDQIVESLSPIQLPSKTLTGLTEKVYLLKRQPFTGVCTFLENNKCKIHKFKPFTCRIYPFALEVIDENRLKVVIHTDKLCSSIKSTQISDSNTLENLQNIMHYVENELIERAKTSK